MGEVANSKLVGVLGCRVGSLPTTYLSLPLGAPFKSLQVWDVVEKDYISSSPCGKDNPRQKEEDRLWLNAPFLA
ncbi:hypothetical protein CK203_023712 [Vitis vinifera]|uniref:Uncharacterized protein n=1 Tax=Vitis vinifera TaxID=29760 RepID=A0A438JBS5_VITVI|nr:hypothetical protein CK203_023712 [Vitis vinifera]